MYRIPKCVEVRAIYNSKKAKVMLRKIFKDFKRTKVKIVFSLKSKNFTGNSADTISDKTNSVSEQSFNKLLDKLTHIKMEHFRQESLGV